MRTAPITTLSDRDIEAIRAFHGHLCPMVLLGARMAREALARLPKTQLEELPFAFFRGTGCALDGVQVISGCTWGNGNLVVLRGRDFSLLMAREGQQQGILVRPLSGILARLRETDSASVLERKIVMEIASGESASVLELSKVDVPAHLTLFPQDPAPEHAPPPPAKREG